MNIKFNEPNYGNKMSQTQQSGITNFLMQKNIVKNSQQALILQLLIIGVFAIVLSFKLFSGTPHNNLSQTEAEKAGNRSEVAPN